MNHILGFSSAHIPQKLNTHKLIQNIAYEAQGVDSIADSGGLVFIGDHPGLLELARSRPDSPLYADPRHLPIGLPSQVRAVFAFGAHELEQPGYLTALENSLEITDSEPEAIGEEQLLLPDERASKFSPWGKTRSRWRREKPEDVFRNFAFGCGYLTLKHYEPPLVQKIDTTLWNYFESDCKADLDTEKLRRGRLFVCSPSLLFLHGLKSVNPGSELICKDTFWGYHPSQSYLFYLAMGQPGDSWVHLSRDYIEVVYGT